MIGQTLGHYKILDKLGAGGMGEVYRAEDTTLERQVALKILPAELAADPDRLERFEREAKTLAALDHPNIVTIYSVELAGTSGESAGTSAEEPIHFLTMQLVEGKPLSQLIPKGGLPLDRIFAIAIPLADALAAAHAKRVVHRDLKPANLMVTPEGRVKVLDFGLAKLRPEVAPAPATELPTESLTAEGRIVGTLPYMSPEQLEGKDLDTRSDIFSLGVVLYEMATGRRPFTGDTSVSLIMSVGRDTPPDVDALREELPHQLGRIINHCLQKDPERRFQAIKDVRNELESLEKETDKADQPAKEPRVESPAPSIAVLPFTDMSPEGDQEYFTDGLTEELINALAQIPELHVAGRTSAFQFKGRTEDLRVIGQKLNVATLLEGSIRKADSRVRITAQLVGASDGFHLWSSTYDREMEDIFEMQQEIAEQVASALQVTLLEDTPTGSLTPKPGHAEAYNTYLLGRHLEERQTEESLRKAIEYYERALALDPNYAKVWAGLASARGKQGGRAYLPRHEAFAKARQAAERAVALDESEAEAWRALGWVKMIYDWDWTGADAAFRRALESKPGDAAALAESARLALILGRLDESLSLHRRAVALEPLSAEVSYMLGFAAYSAGKFEEAAAAFTKNLELEPDFPRAHTRLAQVYLAQGQPEAARDEVERETSPPWRLYGLALVQEALGQRRDAEAALARYIEERHEKSAYQIATIYAAWGEVDPAFQWLERAYTQRDGGCNMVKYDPRLASLHDDPRWAPFLEKMGLNLPLSG